MANVNLQNMSAADRLALMNDLASFQERDAKLTQLVNAFKADLDAAGFTVEEAALLLSPRKKLGRKPGAKVAKKAAAKKVGKKTAAKGKPDSMDSTGAMPIVGKTYVLPTGETWTKQKAGRPNMLFVAAVQAGKTWAQLQKGSLLKSVANAVAKKKPAKKTAAKKAPKKKAE